MVFKTGTNGINSCGINIKYLFSLNFSKQKATIYNLGKILSKKNRNRLDKAWNDYNSSKQDVMELFENNRYNSQYIFKTNSFTQEKRKLMCKKMKKFFLFQNLNIIYSIPFVIT